MVNKKQKNKIKIIKIREQEYNKLSKYKIHPRQAYWEVIKRILEGYDKLNKKDKQK